jgi:putative glutamine amidotransferase
MAEVAEKGPRWFAIPFRVGALTFLLTLLAFAVSLLLSIFGTIVYSQVRHIAPNLPFAYRHIAFPFAITVGSIVLVVSLIVEVRQYRRKRALAGIEPVSGGGMAAPRIAIPVPHSSDSYYAARALGQYEAAVRLAGGEPVRIKLGQPMPQTTKQIEGCDAVLLPGSRADVDPQKYGAARHEKTAASDPKRDRVDELLLQDAYTTRKPVLGICYGLQTLVVNRSGSLVQHIESPVNHAAGRSVPKAHTVEIAPGSRLASIVAGAAEANSSHLGMPIVIGVTSSHHQSADVVGDGLRIVARCPDDGIIEAVEGTAPDHFVLAVQWHPERSLGEPRELSAPAHAIFRAFIEAARARREEPNGELAASCPETQGADGP